MLYITAEDAEFDMETLKAWRDEGFIVEYIPLGNGGKQYVQTLHRLGEKMGIGERYAIVGIQPFRTPAQRRRLSAIHSHTRKHALTGSPQPLETQPLYA